MIPVTIVSPRLARLNAALKTPVSARLAGAPSPAPAAESTGPEVPDGTVADVLGWVGDDPTRVQAAYDAEAAKDSPRSSLLAQLQAKGAKSS